MVNKFDVYIEKEDRMNLKCIDLKNRIHTYREMKKAMKIEIKNYILDNEDKQQRLYELEQININLQNENIELKNRCNEPKEIILSKRLIDF